MKKYIEIGKRLRKFGEDNYSSMTMFAKAIGLLPQTLNNYLSGDARPGNILQEKLRAVNCDIEWLMTSLYRLLLLS